MHVGCKKKKTCPYIEVCSYYCSTPPVPNQNPRGKSLPILWIVLGKLVFKCYLSENAIYKGYVSRLMHNHDRKHCLVEPDFSCHFREI